MLEVRIRVETKVVEEVLRDGKRIRVSPQQFRILAVLSQQRTGRFVGADKLIEVVWENPDDQPLEARKNVGHQIAKIRKKGIEIESKQGWGYRLKESDDS